MSSAPHAHGHDAHESHVFDAEPVKVLAPDEPRTPGWLPVLGIAIFTAAAVYALTTGGDPPASEQPKPEVAAQAAPPTPPTPAAQPTPAARPTPPTPAAQPTPAAAASAQKLSPEEVKQIRDKINGARARGALPTNLPKK